MPRKEVYDGPRLYDGPRVVSHQLTSAQLAKKMRTIEQYSKWKHRSIDKKPYDNKWYIGTYDHYDHLHILNMGWWNKHILRKWLQHKIGMNVLKGQFFFIKGLNLKGVNYTFGRRLYIYNGVTFKKRIIRSKMIYPKEIRVADNRKSFKKLLIDTIGSNGQTKKYEEAFYNLLFSTLDKVSEDFSCTTEQLNEFQYHKNKIKINRNAKKSRK